MAQLTILYWRDIPAQVSAKRGRTQAKQPLDERFAEAIDRAAMRGGQKDSDAYLEAWRRETVPFDGEDLEAAVAACAAELDAAYPMERLHELVRHHGHAPGSSDSPSDLDSLSDPSDPDSPDS